MDALKNCVACGSDNLEVTHYSKLSQPCARSLPKSFSKAMCRECGDSGYYSDGSEMKGRTHVVIEENYKPNRAPRYSAWQRETGDYSGGPIG